MTLLQIENLDVRYNIEDAGDLVAVDGVSFSIEQGETFGLVGESGCGKTTTGKAIIKLLDENGRIEDGTIRFNGQDIDQMSDKEIRDIRWAGISMIPQSAMNGLNPVYRVGDQITEAIFRHQPDVGPDEATERARDLFERVGIEADRVGDYPHQLSGGMRQRAMIAMALACDPDLIIADEPTTALDVIVQDGILEELEELVADFEVSLLVISHDISVIVETCDRIGVMYGGKLMETGPTGEVIENTANPYTMGLLNAFPDIEEATDELVEIPGTPPSLEHPPSGCRFSERCPFATAACEGGHPPMYNVGGTAEHKSACYHLEKVDQIRQEAQKEATWTN